MVRATRATAAAAGALLAVVLAGCGAAEEPPGRGVPSASAGGASPSFSGPFAAEYQEAWTKSGTAAVRAILADEVITDQEWSTVKTMLRDCLAEKGITLLGYTDGSYEAHVGGLDGELANERMGACEMSTGEAWIGDLYRAQTLNPHNIPETQLLTDCLVRNNAVPPTYTEEQYAEDVEEFAFPFLDQQGSETFDSCSSDYSFVR